MGNLRDLNKEELDKLELNFDDLELGGIEDDKIKVTVKEYIPATIPPFPKEQVEHIEQVEQEGESLEQKEVELIIPKCEFLTGGAGTGKTYEIKRRMEEYASLHPERDRKYGILAATTGIAAINLGDDTSTINSVLRFFDTDSLEEAFNSGKLQRSLKEVSHKADFLIIDEVSMMHAKQLDIIWDALVEINQHSEIIERGGLGIILVADFVQLPPVPEKDKYGKPIDPKYCFEAQCWKYFQANTTKLTKNWRQNDPLFVKALEYARRGDGMGCSASLKAHKGVKFCEEIETNFDGTTIFSKNVEVDRLNTTRLRNLLHSGKKGITVKSFRWGKQRGEWKNIPETLELCEEAYVMILANDSRVNGFRYANGTTGYVVKFEPLVDSKIVDPLLLRLESDQDTGEGMFVSKQTPNTFLIKLKSNNLEVEIGKICRQVTAKEHPEKKEKPDYLSLKEWKEENGDRFTTTKQAKYLYEMDYLAGLTRENMKSSHKQIENRCSCGWSSMIGGWGEYDSNEKQFEEHKRKASPEVYFDYNEARWVVGEVYYWPLRLAYASTVHKSQGLTLDKVQIDFSNAFFGQPSMGYVSLSRARTAEGLRIVGSPRLLESRINISRKVLKWI